MFVIKVFLQNTVKMSIVTKRDVIDRVGAEETPHHQQWEVSCVIADSLGRGGSDLMRERGCYGLGTQQVGWEV